MSHWKSRSTSSKNESTADAGTENEIRQTLRVDRRLHSKIERFLAIQPDASTLGDYRLIHELHQRRVAHSRTAVTIDTLKRQAMQLPPTIQLNTSMYGLGMETLRQRGPHLQALVHDMLMKVQAAKAAHVDIEKGLRRDRATLEALESNERVVGDIRLQWEDANRKRLRDLAARIFGKTEDGFGNAGPDGG